MAGYWPSSFLHFYGPRRSQGQEKHQKRMRLINPAILTEQAWSIKDLLYGQKITLKNFALAETKWEIPSRQDRPNSCELG